MSVEAQLLEGVRALCEAHQVRSMALFGSAARADFDPERSDLDLAVDFLSMPPAEHARHYFALLEDLRALFERPVDLVESAAVRNPYLRARMESQQVVLYGA